VLFDVHHLLVLAKKDQVDRKEHADGVHAAGRYDPETAAKLCPALGLAQQADQTPKIIVRDSCLCSDKGFPGLVEHTHRPHSISTVHPDVFSPKKDYDNKFKLCLRLVNRLLFAAPNDDTENNQSRDACDDANRCNIHGFSPYFAFWLPMIQQPARSI
jgi:hypothetical protein